MIDSFPYQKYCNSPTAERARPPIRSFVSRRISSRLKEILSSLRRCWSSNIRKYVIRPSQLTQNLALAEEIVGYVKRTILFSSTHPLKSPTMKAYVENPLLFRQRYDAIHQMISTLQRAITLFDQKSSFLPNKHNYFDRDEYSYLTCVASIAEKFNIGNCHEMAIVGFIYALNRSNQRVELFRIRGGDHLFLVIGRAKRSNSDPATPSTWGANAFICDPWMESYYPANKYRLFLQNYIGVSLNSGGIVYPILERFDPRKHSLELFRPVLLERI